ncbi:hypothetical protein EDB81DRAFT_839076 [Dactylonectria macrodidyma]|uniref:Ornithine cyclodeaminase n=1 Tax=Dactylonectria macrodidyma TaxID=307937 RepID=A0A9P9JNI6_9HYPO|nr:hypothetical protein EDB81DRAFT_839076 [Dactylonectria macrodidyma]
MTFTVLSDSDIKRLFQGQSSDEVASLTHALDQALIQYSTQDEKQYQPHRGVVTRPGGQVSLFMPATTQYLIGVKIVGITAPALKSALTLCDATGEAVGIVNAAELTAFRISLGSMLLYRMRSNTENILVFGAGKQALWHIRLAVLVRGQDIRTVTVVNRSTQRAQDLVETLTNDPESGWPEHIKLQVFDGNASLETLVVAADLLSESARTKSRFISAIGSYRLDMTEIDPELLKEVVNTPGVFSNQVWNGNIAVDTIDGCLQEAGELVKAGLNPDQMVEIGNLQQARESNSSLELDEWLQSGFVIYKSVGIGIMDLAIGHSLLQLASSKGVGLNAEIF